MFFDHFPPIDIYGFFPTVFCDKPLPRPSHCSFLMFVPNSPQAGYSLAAIPIPAFTPGLAGALGVGWREPTLMAFLSVLGSGGERWLCAYSSKYYLPILPLSIPSAPGCAPGY